MHGKAREGMGNVQGRDTTSKSLILVDELGRGTSPREGVGISYAIAEELIRLKVRRILFLLFFQLILFQVFRIFCNVRWFNVWILLPWSYRQFLQPFQ